MGRTQFMQTNLSRNKNRLRDELIPEVQQLLAENITEANKVVLKEDLLQVKDQLRDSKNIIRTGLTEWNEEIEWVNNEERQQEKLEAFLYYRLNGTKCESWER